MTLEILHFVFSSFWVWAGTAILLGIVSVSLGQLLGLLLSAFAGRR
ncbi:hypothetical protein [Sphingobium yanoikuyae]